MKLFQTLNSIRYAKVQLFALILVATTSLSAQKELVQTFKDTRVINTQSIETLKKGHMDFRVGHRFGDIAGSGGGWETFYGLENSTDVSIGFDYGIGDNTMIGVHRMKGSNVLRQIITGSIKYRLMTQEIGGNKPFSLAVYAMTAVSTAPNCPNQGSLCNFDVFLHRVGYHIQLLASKKIGSRFSIQVHPAWTYRNLVPENGDTNDLVSLGFASHYQLNKSLGIIFEGNFPLSEIRTPENEYYPSIGFGLEWETGGGHVFQINLTNATGMTELDYIPYTQSSWADGEFRFGFTIGRQFKL